MPGSTILFSAQESYLRAAATELREAFPSTEIDVVAPDTGRLLGDNLDISKVATACRERPVVFVRHLTRVLAEIPIQPLSELQGRLSSCCLNVLAAEDIDSEIALQIWKSGDSPFGERTDNLWRDLAAALGDQGYVVSRGNRAQILSVLIAPKHVFVGVNRRDDALVDWPGGRLSLAKSAGQVSRSEFKLEELFKLCDIPVPVGGTALDLGASPGGWTRILRQRGLRVWAVDPADLDPRIAADPNVHHERTTAGPFLARTQERFDLIVDDMRMSPTRSCGVILDAARRLNADGFVIVTLKISPRQALETVRTALTLLERSYDTRFARQLYHNRNEITVVGKLRRPTKRASAGGRRTSS